MQFLHLAICFSENNGLLFQHHAAASRCASTLKRHDQVVKSFLLYASQTDPSPLTGRRFINHHMKNRRLSHINLQERVRMAHKYRSCCFLSIFNIQLNDVTVNLDDVVESRHKLTPVLNCFKYFQLLINDLLYMRS